jgi:hypothetical protein
MTGLTGKALDAVRDQAPEDMAIHAAGKLAREHPGAMVGHIRRRGRAWGLAATVTGDVVSGTMTVLGAIEEVSDWLDLVTEATRLARKHPCASVRVAQTAAGMWVLSARLGDDPAEGDAGLVAEWLALKDRT